MIGLWDTTGDEVVKALQAERRSAGGVASGMALSLIVVVDEKRVREAEAAATIASAAHPCRLLIVVRSDVDRPTQPARRGDRRRRPARPVRGRGHADVRPAGPARRVGGDAPARAGRAGGHLVARPAAGAASPTTSSAWSPTGGSPTARRPPTRSRRCGSGPTDYAPGDTDLAWTRITPWRTLVASAFDTTDDRRRRRARSSRRPPTRRRALMARLVARPAAASHRAWEDTTEYPRLRCVSLPAPTATSWSLTRDDGTATFQPHRPARPRSCRWSRRAARRRAGRGAAAPRPRPDLRGRRCGAVTGRTGLDDRPPLRVHVLEGPDCRRVRRAASMTETSVVVHADPDVLAQAVAARLIVALIDAQADRGEAGDRADRRADRVGGLPGRRGRCRRATRSTGRGSTSGGATSGSCPPGPRPQRDARRARRCSTRCR